MGYRLGKLAEYIRGWMGYFRITEYYRPIPLLDQWIRRRIRCCVIKQWRKPKNRYRNLVMLGVDRIKAAATVPPDDWSKRPQVLQLFQRRARFLDETRPVCALRELSKIACTQAEPETNGMKEPVDLNSASMG